ncbi:MAG: AI-2E family transporter [Anaerolineaceae bacterium]|nr:AI-2E family transporter [Anaerolineaceae bacterium]
MDAVTRLDVNWEGVQMKTKNQSKWTQDILLYAILLAGIGWLIFTYKVLLGPLIISGLIAYLLYPLVTWLADRTRIDRRRIVPLVYLIFLGLLVWAIIYLTPIITSQASLLSGQLAKLPDQVEILDTQLESFLGFKLPFDSFIEEFETDMTQLLKPDRVFRVLRGATTNIVWVIIIFITSFHLLRDWEHLREWLFGLSPENLEPDLRRLHQEIKTVWQAYLRGQILIMSILGVLSGIGAAVIGLPGALILGFLAGALSLIPSLGPATATAVAAFVAWTQGSTYLDISNLAAALIVVAIFQVIQLIEGFWLTPRIMGRRLNLHPGLILIAVVGTLFTLGALMTLITVPLLASLDLIFRYARRKQAGLDPWPVQETPQSVNSEEEL